MRKAEARAVALRRPSPAAKRWRNGGFRDVPFCLVGNLTALVGPPDATLGGGRRSAPSSTRTGLLDCQSDGTHGVTRPAWTRKIFFAFWAVLTVNLAA
jgi:hypothetical protein